MAATLTPRKVGAALRQARERANIRVEAPALHVGLSAQSMYAIETGRRRPRVDVVVALADFYGVSLDELLRPDAVGDV